MDYAISAITYAIMSVSTGVSQADLKEKAKQVVLEDQEKNLKKKLENEETSQ